jgi:hypothetical protein
MALTKFGCTFSFSSVGMIFAWSSANTEGTSTVSFPVKIVIVYIIAVRTEVIFEVT